MTKELPIGPSSPMQQKAVEVFQEVQVLVLGGAMFGGKSYLAAMLSLLYADDPKSRIAVFRRTLGEMTQGGGIIDTIKSVYESVGESCKLDVSGNPPVGKILTGPGAGIKRGEGCKINFRPMNDPKDLEKVRGGAYSLAIVEEATPYFSQEEIEMIMSRLRSESRHESKMIITCNPLNRHFVCDMIKDYYLDEQGYAIKERLGDIRYFYKISGDYLWANSREGCLEQAIESGAEFIDHETGEELPYEEKLMRMTSFSFVQLTAKDNPLGIKANPGYMAYLEGLDPVKKARNLYGNWYIEEEGGSLFERWWIRGENGVNVKRPQDVPKGCIAMRAVDVAGTEPHDNNTDPDYTALSPLILKDPEGYYWMLGGYHKDFIDPKYRKIDKPVHGRVRKRPGDRNNLIVQQVELDKFTAEAYGCRSYSFVITKDSGAGGSADYYSLLTHIMETGVKVVTDKEPNNVPGKKAKDFAGFCDAASNGLIRVVESTFNEHTPDTSEVYWKELEDFTGEKQSTRRIKDDMVDSTSLCFNNLVKSKRPYKTPSRNITMTNTLSTGLY